MITELLVQTVSEPKTVSSLLYIAAGGLISAVVYLYYNSETKTKAHIKAIQDINDKYQLKLENLNEQNVSLLEKTLNGLTGIEKMIIENNATLNTKIIDSIKETNAPLIQEIKELLKKNA